MGIPPPPFLGRKYFHFLFLLFSKPNKRCVQIFSKEIIVSLWRIKYFASTRHKKFDNKTINSHFKFVLEENLGRKIKIIATLSFSKSSFFKFSVPKKAQSRRFKILPFSRQISVEGRPNRRYKALFLIFSSVLMTFKTYKHNHFSLLVRSENWRNRNRERSILLWWSHWLLNYFYIPFSIKSKINCYFQFNWIFF